LLSVFGQARWLTAGKNPVLLYLDSRHPAAALAAAQLARARRVPIVVEADAVSAPFSHFFSLCSLFAHALLILFSGAVHQPSAA
jgi:hypothetical protein